MMKQIFQLIALSFLLLACRNGYTGEIRTVKKETIEIKLPDWLEETNDLAPHAFYQFKSRYRNTYGIVVKEKKGLKSLGEYHKESLGVLRNFKELTNLFVTDSSSSKNVIQLELMGDIETEKIFYWHNTYESKNHFYQLVLWTRSYDRKQNYAKTIEDVIASFKILD